MAGPQKLPTNIDELVAQQQIAVGVPQEDQELQRARDALSIIKNRGNPGNVINSGIFQTFLNNPNATQEEQEFAQYVRARGYRPEKVFALSDAYFSDFIPLNTLANQANVSFEDVLNPNSPNEGISAEGRRALAEKAQTEETARRQKGQITEFADEFSTAADEFRKRLRGETEAGLGRLRTGLEGSRKTTFEQNLPFLLEDLNRRGLLNSETALAQAQARELGRLSANDEGILAQARLSAEQGIRGFEAGAFSQEQALRGGGLEALIGGEQAALDRALGLRRTKLERDFAAAQAAADRATAEALARRKRRGGIAEAAIGALGSVLGGFAGRKGGD